MSCQCMRAASACALPVHVRCQCMCAASACALPVHARCQCMRAASACALPVHARCQCSPRGRDGSHRSRSADEAGERRREGYFGVDAKPLLRTAVAAAADDAMGAGMTSGSARRSHWIRRPSWMLRSSGMPRSSARPPTSVVSISLDIPRASMPPLPELADDTAKQQPVPLTAPISSVSIDEVKPEYARSRRLDARALIRSRK